MTTLESKWVRVSRQAPCPICKKPDWCTYTEDGELANCMRVESDRALPGNGWLHRLKDPAVPRRSARYVPPAPAASKPSFDAETYHAALIRAETDEHWVSTESGLAVDLGVPMQTLMQLGCVYDPAHLAWAFPMRDGDGSICGIRLRAANGRKWAVKGSREGLFYSPLLDPCDELTIVEGPTDTAAALALGIPVVGRPSCLGGVMQVWALVRRLGVRKVNLLVDNDAPHRRPDGSVFYPGKDGVRRLVEQLKIPYRVVMPPAKDLREWLKAGATRAELDALVGNSEWRQ